MFCSFSASFYVHCQAISINTLLQGPGLLCTFVISFTVLHFCALKKLVYRYIKMRPVFLRANPYPDVDINQS